MRLKLLLYSVLLWPSSLTLAMAAEAQWMVAAGSVQITPTEPVWMGGYAARTKPSQAIESELFAKVLFIEDAAGNRLVIVTMDLLGITPELRTGVEALVAQYGIPSESLLMNASHTHCGPELRAERITGFGFDAKWAARSKQYVRSTANKIAKLIEDTSKRLAPSRLVYSHARAGFAMNRRLPTESGFKNSPNPDGPVDHSVPVLQVRDASSGQLKAVLFGYACHATTLSFQNLCADWPGYAQQYVQEAHPGVVAMFMNGCSADQNPYPRRTLDLAKQHGRALANGVETALETKRTTELTGSLRVAMKNATLRFATPPTSESLKRQSESTNKYERYHAKALLSQIENNGAIVTEQDIFPMQVARIGKQMTLIAICGEVVVDYSIRLKRELADEGGVVWVAGYSNHVFGYLPSLRVLKEGGYEGGGAMLYTTLPGPFEESVEDRVIETVTELIDATTSN